MRSRMHLEKVVNGDRENIKTVFSPLLNRVWYSLKIRVDGDSIEVWKNNNRDNKFELVISETDEDLSNGSIGLFCWKNKGAWFDNLLVTSAGGDVLLVECFDYGRLIDADWISVGEGSHWYTTPLSPEQEELYKMFDSAYRELLFCAHYKPENVYYLSVHRWADCDGDGNYSDVDAISTRWNAQYAIQTWLKQVSDENDMNLIYITSHGNYKKTREQSFFGLDTVRDGAGATFIERLAGYPPNPDTTVDLYKSITDDMMRRWLQDHNYGSDIGRLTFLLETCFAGHFIDELSTFGEDRIIITTSTKEEPAELETGQDWSPLSSKFFEMLANGSTSVAEAFDVADEHTEVENFMSIYVLQDWGFEKWPQDARMDDDGKLPGSSYDTPNREDGELAANTGL